MSDFVKQLYDVNILPVVRADANIVTPKIKIWDRIVIKQTGNRDFSAQEMCHRASRRRGSYFSPAVEVLEGESSSTVITDEYEMPYGTASITFGIGTRDHLKADGIIESAVSISQFGALKFDRQTSKILQELKLSRVVQKMTADIAEDASHDFVHNATFFSRIDNALNKDKRNWRGKISGYENYSLIMHQEIFQERRKDPNYVNAIHRDICALAHLADRIGQNPKHQDVAGVLYKFIESMLGNYVDGSHFKDKNKQFSKDRAVWREGLLTGKPTPCEGFWIRDQRFSAAEVSLMAYERVKDFVGSPDTTWLEWQRSVTRGNIIPGK